MPTKHTPGPWDVWISDSGEIIEIQLEATKINEQPFVVVCWSGFDQCDVTSLKEQAANAKFIVKACNSHDDLLAALKDLLPMWENGIEEPWVEAARAAIKKATS